MYRRRGCLASASGAEFLKIQKYRDEYARKVGCEHDPERNRRAQEGVPAMNFVATSN